MLIVDFEKFFESYRTELGSLNSAQEEGLKVILEAFTQDLTLEDSRHAAYMLATTYHETAQTFKPIAEYGKRAYFSRYEGRQGNTRAGDGYRYRGRGYVQLTFRANYQKAGERLSRLTRRYPDGVNLENDPDLALNSQIAADIMLLGMREGWFTGKNLGQYIQGDKKDYYHARRIINGLDRAEEISHYAERFEAILESALVSAQAESPRTLWSTTANSLDTKNYIPRHILW